MAMAGEATGPAERGAGGAARSGGRANNVPWPWASGIPAAVCAARQIVPPDSSTTRRGRCGLDGRNAATAGVSQDARLTALTDRSRRETAVVRVPRYLESKRCGAAWCGARGASHAPARVPSGLSGAA